MNDSYTTFSINDLAKLPKPRWNIQNVEQAKGLTMIHGNPGSMKTYVEVDKALKLAAGVDHYFGFKNFGRVGTLHVLGEGTEFLLSRINSWIDRYPKANRHDLLELYHVLPTAVDISDEKVIDRLILTLKERGLNRLILDTYSRMMPGVDENNQAVISIIVNHLDEIQRQADCHVTLVHHNNAMGKYRGSTVLDGALDTRFETLKEGGVVKIVCHKMKNAPDNIEFVAQPLAVGQSVVLIPQTTLPHNFPYTKFTQGELKESAASDQDNPFV